MGERRGNSGSKGREDDFSGLKGRTLRLLSTCTIFALAIESGDGNRVSSSTWLDAQHPSGAIAQRQPQRIALHAVAATGVMATAATVRTRPRPTRRIPRR